MSNFPTNEYGPEYQAMLDMEARRIYSVLQVAEEDERQALSQETGTVSEAVKLGKERSFLNIRNSVRQYLQWRLGSGVEPAQILSELETKTQEIQDGLVMAYYTKFGDAQNILQNGALKNLYEFASKEQDERKKPMEISLQDALIKRKNVDEALGWRRPETVYHLAVEQRGEGHHPEGPGRNYGAIRFIFDFEILADHSTFTEGDSLNASQLPHVLASKRGNFSATRGVEARQISAEHVPVAKAIMDLGTALEQRAPKTGIFLRYIEAQVGEVTGSQIFQNLKGIEVNLEEAFYEARRSRLIFDKNKQDQIYKEYLKRDPDVPVEFPNFDKPAKLEEKPDFEGYDRAIAELHALNFQDLVNQLKQFCESKGIVYEEKGDMKKIQQISLELIKNRR